MKRTLALMALAVLLAGCASQYEKSADRETLPLVRDYQAKVDGERPEETPAGVITPKPEGAQAEPAASEGPAEAEEVINLKEALSLAFSNGRDFRFQKESLYLSALGLTLTRHDYTWKPSATISGEISMDGNGDGATETEAGGDATLGIVRRLLAGGTFSVTGTVSQSGAITGAGGNANSGNVSATLRQPLLSGAGAAGRESLVQAERSLLYDARDFELFRQRLAISIISDYYGLLRQRRFIESAEANVKRLTFLYDRSVALFNKDKLTLVDKLRALQEKLQSENRLNDQRVAYSLALDKFKITLGLTTDRKVEIADEAIEPEIVTVDLAAAVTTALANRLDLMSAREQLEDSERKLHLSRNRLLPELELVARAGIGSEAGHSFLDMAADSGGSASVGLTLDLPVDKKAERNSYKSSLVSLEREKRAFSLTEDNVKLSVRDTVNNLHQSEVSLAIQKQNVEQARLRVEAAQLLFEKGQYGTRDLVEAESAVLDAENAYVQAQVDYLIASVQLRKDIGTLRVDENGNWR